MLRRGLVWLFAGAFLFGTASAGYAHDSWISGGKFRNPNTGEWCCGKHDCFPVPSSLVAPVNKGYEIRHLGEIVPYDQALPSADDRYWRCHRPDGTRRCFFAPQKGS
jgi:hypothetical protein